MYNNSNDKVLRQLFENVLIVVWKINSQDL